MRRSGLKKLECFTGYIYTGKLTETLHRDRKWRRLTNCCVRETMLRDAGYSEVHSCPR